jgi:replicative DNA helicase
MFIDHLHFILKKQDGESQEQCIGRTVRTLKQLAVKWNIVIVLIAHLRKVELDKEPNLEDLKDSSAIAQEADTVMFMWRQTVKEGKTRKVLITDNVTVSVQANRKTGRTGNVKLTYKKGRFLEHEWEDDGQVDKAWNEMNA